jgi:hypothetical protein
MFASVVSHSDVVNPAMRCLQDKPIRNREPCGVPAHTCLTSISSCAMPCSMTRVRDVEAYDIEELRRYLGGEKGVDMAEWWAKRGGLLKTAFDKRFSVVIEHLEAVGREGKGCSKDHITVCREHVGFRLV